MSEIEVKALEWRVFCSRSGNCEAKTQFGEYVIQSETDGWCLYLLNQDDAHAAYSTLEYAQVAAQSDYDARIRSALVERKAEPVAWVIPGDDTARPDGFIDAMAWREGEFTRPLFSTPHAAAVTGDELRRAADALLNNLWAGVVSGARTHEENWTEFGRRYPGVRWLHAALSASPSPVDSRENANG